MAKMTPVQEASYALGYGLSRDDLPPAAQTEYDRLAAEQARRVQAERAGDIPVARPASRRKPKPEPTPSGVMMLGALVGWGPWSAVIGAWQAFGKSGYTINGQSASTSAAHGICQAGQAAAQPGICGSIDAHYTFGVALLVVGGIAFVGGLIGMFITQQSNPRAWRQAWTPFVAGLIFGVFAVAVTVVIAIVRGVRDGAASPGAAASPAAVTSMGAAVSPDGGQAWSAGAAAPASAWGQPGGMNQTAGQQPSAQWRVSAEGGWEWLASDGRWYPQQLAPAGLLPPAPPPPVTGTQYL